MISLSFPITYDGAQTVIIGFFFGLAAERAFTSLLILWLRSVRPQKQDKLLRQRNLIFLPSIPSIMIFFNISCLVYMLLAYWNLSLDEATCVVVQTLLNVTSHIFYCSFNYFLLLKTYMFTRQNSVVAYILVIIFLHRLCWTLMDIVSSKGQWVDQECVYDQNPLSGIGYNAADILIDVVCSGLSILYSWEFLSSDFTRIGEVIVGENVLRSLVILSVNSFEIYASFMFTDFFMLRIAFCIQNYAYPFALNAELLWLGIRQRSVNTTAGSHNQLFKAIRRSVGPLNQSIEESQKMSLDRQLINSRRFGSNIQSITSQ